ncbi:MAG: hypothetical protein LBI18_07160 [Planctomycetaceae bacterium]|jgi:hypothetical protein|nr:hypothetical protein [Planctomycetaceae bacterium]
MTQQFGNSLEIQGNTDPFPSEFCFIPVSVAPAVHSTKQKLKKKRGRPRKALPINILSADFLAQTNQNDWKSRPSVAETERNRPAVANSSVATTPPIEPSRKKQIAPKNLLHDDYFASNHSDTDLPFADDELTTLDKFEKLSRSVERNSGCSYDKKKIDRPATTPVSVPTQKKNVRRRQIDPSTCERDYSQDEVEFMNALNEYKRTSGRMFPTCSEILEVLKSLGYEKQDAKPELHQHNYCRNNDWEINRDCRPTENIQSEIYRYGITQKYFDFSPEN